MKKYRKFKLLTGTIMLVFTFLAYHILFAGKVADQQIEQNQIPGKQKPHIVFLITKDSLNYEADQTIPLFAEMLKKDSGYEVTVLLGSGRHGSYRYPSLDALSKADLLVVFARRIALPHDQMNAIKNYLGKGKPLIGIRTANHAFNVREKMDPGFEEWPGFVSDILGCENRGYGPTEPGTDVSVVAEAANHPILKDLSWKQWHSTGNVYLVAPLLDKEAIVLLEGKADGKTQPIAWTRTSGSGRVFYTSLGHPTDFKKQEFISFLLSGIKWALD